MLGTWIFLFTFHLLWLFRSVPWISEGYSKSTVQDVNKLIGFDDLTVSAKWRSVSFSSIPFLSQLLRFSVSDEATGSACRENPRCTLVNVGHWSIRSSNHICWRDSWNTLRTIWQGEESSWCYSWAVGNRIASLHHIVSKLQSIPSYRLSTCEANSRCSVEATFHGTRPEPWPEDKAHFKLCGYATKKSSMLMPHMPLGL